MPLSNEKRRELYRQRKSGTMVPKSVVPKSVVPESVVPESVVPESVVPENGTILTRLDKLEQVVSSLALVVNALQRRVGLMERQQKLSVPDYNPESW